MSTRHRKRAREPRPGGPTGPGDPVRWHALPPAEAAQMLGSDPTEGLAEHDAALRLRRYGPNSLGEGESESFVRLLLAQFTSIFVLILILAAGISMLLGERLDAGAIVAIVVLNALLGSIQERRASRALEALRRIAAPNATVVREGVARRIPADGLVPGDLVEVNAGDAVPADARLVSASGLQLAEAALTGESFAVAKSTGAVAADAPLAERSSMLYGGTLVVGGKGRAIVTSTGRSTEFGRIAELVLAAGREPTPLEEGLDRTGRWLVAGAIGAAVLVFLVGVVSRHDLGESFLTAVALAVAAIPEGLPAAVTIVLALGVQRMVARHAIVRRLAAVETLGCTTIICTDKTGTLTQNALSVRRLWSGGSVFEVEAHRVVRPPGTAAPPGLDGAFRAIALSLGPGDSAAEGTIDPTDVALARLVGASGRRARDSRPELRLARELPFDSDRKRSGVIYGAPGGGHVLAVKGAPEAIIQRCTFVACNGALQPLDATWLARLDAAVAEFANEGLRPIAIALREVPPGIDLDDPDSVEQGLTLAAVVGMIDALRPGVSDAIQVARRAGIRTIMITGDHPATARAIARDAGLGETPAVLTGGQLEAMDEAALASALATVDVLARVTSEDKLRVVRALKRTGAVVAMTGDGVNDAPALRQADIGVAMGLGGTDAAREAADVVLTDDNYASIVAAVEEGRTIFSNIRRFVMYLVAGNLAEIAVVLIAGLSGNTALLPAQILWVNLVTDGPPALALGLEPAEPAIMTRPPRDTRAGVLTRRTLPRILASTVLIAAPTLLAFVLGHRAGGVEEARHFAFGTLVVAHMLAALTFRSDHVPLHRLGLRGNRTLLYAVLGALALQALVFYVPPAQAALRTDAFTPLQLALVVALALPALAVPEFVKEVRYRRRAARETEPIR